ncbi:MAG: hypothetical protein WC806_04350, partial [Candidatus Gracilibacteria bacterium]
MQKKQKLKIRLLNKTFFIIIFTLGIALNAFAFFNTAKAISIPHYLGYEGQLTDQSDTALTGSYNMTFRIYDAASAGNLLWTETHSGVSVSQGYFSVNLGSETTLDLAFDEQYWISLAIGSDSEMTPRTSINAVAYSYSADTAYGTYVTNTAPLTTAAGKLYYNSGNGNLYVYDAVGGAWVDLTNEGISALADLSDINSSTATTGNIMMANGLSWDSVAQSNITALGTILSGVWNGTAIGDAYISSAATWNAKQAALTVGVDYLAPTGNGSGLTNLTSSQVGLGSVENTALSTWAGTTNITTLGTISS